MVGSLGVFLQRQICEMDLETSEKIAASFLFLSCSLPSSFFFHEVLFLLIFYFSVL